MTDPRDIVHRPAPEGFTTRYGGDADQVIEWFPPDGPATATVVFLHGGFWRAQWDRAHVRPLCHALTAAGYVVASVEYRRTGGGGGYPATFDDVAAGIGAVAAEVARGHAPGPIVLSGHSAGGQLALWAARPGLVPALDGRLAGVAALAPVSDLERCHTLDLDDGAVDALLGGGPADNPAGYADADPIRHEPPTRVALVHGTQDQRVPVDMSRHYAARYGARLHELPGIEHFGLIDPLSTAWPAVEASITFVLTGA